MLGSGPMGGPDREEIEVHRGTGHRQSGGAGSRCEDGGALPGHGIRRATFHARAGQFGGIEVADGKRPRVLEERNARRKRLPADAMPDRSRLKDLLSRKR